MKYFFDMEGEDHIQFVFECDADNRNAAHDICEEIYPEAKIIGCQSETEYRETEQRRYDYMLKLMEYPERYDDYDYC